MPESVWSPEVSELLSGSIPEHPLALDGTDSPPAAPFPSPADWRDHWIYFLLIDRFANPDTPPAFQPWDGEHGVFQGGTFKGIQGELDYLKRLGVGAIWLSPVQKNCQYSPFTYHGYGFQDFLAIEPRFSSDPEAARADPAIADREFSELVTAAHERGIYVILDIVLNHAGDVFEYEGHGPEAPWNDSGYAIRWRDATGAGRPDWSSAPASPDPDAAVWPVELRRNEFFRRKGLGGEAGGDFASLKEMVTGFEEPPGRYPVRSALIRAYQYFIAKFDIDGFRIDTLKYIEPDFARVFGNAIREFALGIGKKNFFTFGEVYDNEEKISHFIGRFATDASELVGVDAALDFPLFYRLPSVAKGSLAPSHIVDVFEHRKQIQRHLISSHGEAGRYFVTFLDNHDQRQRMHYADPADPGRYDHQLTLAVSCLFALQGIPCLYYGTEQGLHGRGGSDAAVRESLWGAPEGLDESHPFFETINRLSAVRSAVPALRYGRQYFRPISGDGTNFGISLFQNGVLSFSRILNETEVLVVANTSTTDHIHVAVLVDATLSSPGSRFNTLFSNQPDPAPAGPAIEKPRGQVSISEVGGAVTNGPALSVRVSLRPMEVQILRSPLRR